MQKTELKFNSQVCTTREQSQRLLDLGLKPETADMVLIKELAYDEVAHCTYDADTYMIRPIDYLEGEQHRGHIPAWSLHRLFDIMYVHCHELKACENVYDAMIKRIEKTIEHNTHNEYYFNKEYLKQ